MPRDAIERAIIEIVANVAPFERDLEQTLPDAFKELGKIANRVLDGIEGDMSQIRKTAQFALVQTFLESEEAIDDVGDVARRVFDRIRNSMKEAKLPAEQINRLLEEMADELADANRAAIRFQGAMEDIANVPIREMNREIDLVGDAIENLRGGAFSVLRGFDAMADAARTFGRTAAAAFKKADTRLTQVQRKLRDVRFIAQDLRFVLGAGLFTAAIGEAIRFGVESNQALTETRLGLQAIAADLAPVGVEFQNMAGEAEQGFGVIAQLAQDTPLDIRDVSAAMRRLVAITPSIKELGDELSFQGRLEESEKAFLAIGDALTLVGNPGGLDATIKAIGDIGAAGKLTGEEMRQLRNQLTGIDVRSTITRGIFELQGTTEDVNGIMTQFIGLLEETSGQTITAETDFNSLNAAMVKLQGQGLIPAEIATQGLLEGLTLVAGAEGSMDRFTQTVAGNLEKLREAAVVAADEGFKPLAGVLTENLANVKDSVGTAFEDIGNGFTNLVDAGIAPAIQALDVFGVFVGKLFNDLADFTDEHMGGITKLLEDFRGVLLQIPTDVLAELFFELARSLVIFADGFVDLLPLLGGFTSLLNLLNDILDPLPDSLAAVTLALIAMNRAAIGQGAIAGLSAVIGKLGLAGLTGSQGLFKMVGAVTRLGQVLRFAAVPAALLASTFAVRGFAKGIDKQIESITDEFNEMARVMGEQGEDGVAIAAAQIDEFGGRLAAAQEQMSGFGGFVQGVFGAMTPFTTQAELAAQSVDGLEFALANAQTSMMIAAKTTQFLDQNFQKAFNVDLNSDQIKRVADLLGIDLAKGGGAAAQALAEFQRKGGNVPDLLRSIGVELPTTSGGIREAANAADLLESNLSAATTALQEQLDTQRAATDPAFALIKAQRDIAKANEDLIKDGASEAEKLDAALDLSRGVQALQESAVAIGGVGGIPAITESFQDLLVNSGVEGGNDAFSLINATLQENTPLIETQLTNLADAADVNLNGGLLTAFTEGTDAAINELIDFDEDLKEDMQGKAERMLEQATALGINLPEGLAAGIEAGEAEALRAAERLADLIRQRVREALAIASPSRVMMEIGRFVGAGLVVGMESMAGKVGAGAQGLAGAITAGASDLSIPSIGSGNLGALSASGGGQQITNNSTRVVEAPVTVQGGHADPVSIGRAVSHSIASKMGV